MQLAEALIWAGMFLALIIFGRLALRARSTRSLQFQLSVFLLIWTAAESLRLLESVGLIQSSPESLLLGLGLHTVSMLAYAFFLVYRWGRLAR